MFCLLDGEREVGGREGEAGKGGEVAKSSTTDNSIQHSAFSTQHQDSISIQKRNPA